MLNFWPGQHSRARVHRFPIRLLSETKPRPSAFNSASVAMLARVERLVSTLEAPSETTPRRCMRPCIDTPLRHSNMKNILVATIVVVLSASSFAQTTIFSENFESTTGSSLPAGWTVKPGKFGASASNPLSAGINTSGRVLTFTSPTTNDDTFSAVFDLSAYKTNGQTVTLTFDFLSSATTNHPLLVGLNPNNTSGTTWIAGSSAQYPGAGAPTFFSGTGSWVSVSVDLTSYITANSAVALQTTYLSFERWNDASVSSASSVYVDNLSITAVPEPSTYAAIAGALALVGVMVQRARRRSAS